MSRGDSWRARLSGVAAVVQGQQQGTGTLITPSLVLTCAHVIGAAHSARVVIPGGTEPQLCQAVWSDAQLDAALLLSQTPLVEVSPTLVTALVSRDRPEVHVPMGSVTTDRPVRGCEIAGYPQIQRYDGGRLELDQYTGTVLPLAGLIRKTMVFEFDRPPAPETSGDISPLAGLSGGPVYTGDTLLGIVRSVPRGRNHQRAECVPISQVLADTDVREWFERRLGREVASALGRHTATHRHEDSPYEEEYAEALVAEYRKTRIFGLDELSRRESEWDLDTAYLSLEAIATWGHRSTAASSKPERIEVLLADHPRVLLRGDAGSGKTTLVSWLAAHAAAGTLNSRLAALNGMVPFVVPLRTLRARSAGFPTPSQLPGAARLMIDEAPSGWVGRVLESGRALLLVDGLDEVPYEDREEAHRWLSSLLKRYPGTRCLATVRPLAVAPDWLESEGFAELRLLPMRDEDIREFVANWHRADRLNDPHAPQELEDSLSRQLANNPTLRDLARTPLLCAVICALHKVRQGFLPDTRWALYRSALEMMLGERDKRRTVATPEGFTLNIEEQQQLLQRIAVWLVRGGQNEFTWDQALHQLNRTLGGMPRVQALGPPEQILTYMLNRSGLLHELTDKVYQFVHRTFRDFLAAKEFVEGDELQELLRHSRETHWHDVLLLSAGHCSRKDLNRLVNGLLDAGDAVVVNSRGGHKVRRSLYKLAVLCAQHGAWLEESTQNRIQAAGWALTD
ncbi:NACHT domain-containing protein [Streptomyces tibetensis]|uniref:NACHT domain-containing protein n=1 Tax=Streptomyces tibetensis TaxID=2382123 RepID=UPI0037F728E2